METALPRLLITGASGFIGRHLVDALKDEYLIYGLSRRAPKNPALLQHPNIRWIEVDIGDRSMLWESMQPLREQGGVDYFVHLAGFYDYAYDENPEYHRTNVAGTEFVLEQARTLNVRRFVFASSVAACTFPRKEGAVTEATPPDAAFAYARSKRVGEEMVRASSKYFPCSVVRFAAVFSDWCEYGPLYVFVNTWLNRGWKSRVLGGRGESAITYVHINDVVEVLRTILRKSASLPGHAMYVASPDAPVSHRELFGLSTRFFYGMHRAPWLVPKPLAYAGVLAMDLLGRAVGRRPFERPWMMRYIDRKLLVDASVTRSALGWKPAERYAIQRRLLFMIERMKSSPVEWQRRNLRALKSIATAPNFRIYEALDLQRDRIIRQILADVLGDATASRFPEFRTVYPHQVRQDLLTMYRLLTLGVRTKERMALLDFCRQIAAAMMQEGFRLEALLHLALTSGRTIERELVHLPELRGMEQQVYDEITLTFRLAADEIEAVFEAPTRGKEP